MAEEEKEESKEEESKSEKSGGSNIVLILIVVLLVVVLAIGGVVAYLMLSGDDEEAAGAETTQEQVVKKKKKHKSSDELAVGPMYPLDKFTVNLMSDNGRRFLVAKMNLEESGEELTPELDKKTPMIRDIIISILSSKTVEEITTAKGKEKLKEEILSQINKHLDDGEIRHIYFTQFVIQ